MGLRVVCISDTHMSHFKFNYDNMPDGDILIHAGDLSGRTTMHELVEFNAWLGSLEGKYREIYVVPGNHDGQFVDVAAAQAILTNAKVLFDNLVEFDGYKIYGTPWTLTFFDWWFMKNPGEINEVWEKIPNDVDILISHQPPYGILDSALNFRNRTNILSVGCKALREHVLERLNLKLHVFGHLHMDGGQQTTVGDKPTIFVNASINDDYYNPCRKPIVVEI